MKYILFLILTTFLSCRQESKRIIYSDYKNKSTNKIVVGERFQLIFSSNSCCPNGQLDKSTLKSLEYIKDSVVLPAPDDCDGCTSYYTVIFKGIKPGTDTVRFIFRGDPFDNSVNKDSTIFIKDSFEVSVSQ